LTPGMHKFQTYAAIVPVLHFTYMQKPRYRGPLQSFLKKFTRS
jgi:hypothetical protein